MAFARFAIIRAGLSYLATSAIKMINVVLAITARQHCKMFSTGRMAFQRFSIIMAEMLSENEVELRTQYKMPRSVHSMKLYRNLLT